MVFYQFMWFSMPRNRHTLIFHEGGTNWPLNGIFTKAQNSLVGAQHGLYRFFQPKSYRKRQNRAFGTALE